MTFDGEVKVKFQSIGVVSSPSFPLALQSGSGTEFASPKVTGFWNSSSIIFYLKA